MPVKDERGEVDLGEGCVTMCIHRVSYCHVRKVGDTPRLKTCSAWVFCIAFHFFASKSGRFAVAVAVAVVVVVLVLVLVLVVSGRRCPPHRPGPNQKSSSRIPWVFAQDIGYRIQIFNSKS